MCDMSYATYRYQKLKVGILGQPPHFFPSKSGIDGTDIRLLRLLAEKLKFMPDVVVPRTYDQGANMVKKKYHIIEKGKLVNDVLFLVCQQRNRCIADEGPVCKRGLSRQRIHETNWRDKFSLFGQGSTANSKLSHHHQSL